VARTEIPSITGTQAKEPEARVEFPEIWPIITASMGISPADAIVT
jgi:hypothetical protein